MTTNNSQIISFHSCIFLQSKELNSHESESVISRNKYFVLLIETSIV